MPIFPAIIYQLAHVYCLMLIHTVVYNADGIIGKSKIGDLLKNGGRGLTIVWEGTHVAV